MRTLWLEFPQDKEVYEKRWESSQFLVGPSLLVAPILEEGIKIQFSWKMNVF